MIVVTASLRNALARRRKALVIRSRFDPGASDVANPMTADGPSVLMPIGAGQRVHVDSAGANAEQPLQLGILAAWRRSKVRMRIACGDCRCTPQYRLGVVGKRFRGALHPDAAEIVLVCNRTRRR